MLSAVTFNRLWDVLDCCGKTPQSTVEASSSATVARIEEVDCGVTVMLKMLEAKSREAASVAQRAVHWVVQKVLQLAGQWVESMVDQMVVQKAVQMVSQTAV